MSLKRKVIVSMSACLVMQQYDKIFIGSDTAVSGIVDNKIKRIHNNGEKIFNKDGYIIFCSGNMITANNLINHIKNMNSMNIKNIQKYIREIYNTNNMFEIFIADCNKVPVKTYNMSSYRNFDLLITKCKQEETQLYTLGFKTNEIMDSASKNIKTLNGNIVKIYENSFNENCCEEIGGKLKLYYSINCNINKKEIKLNDKYAPLFDSFLDKNVCNYLTAETLVGKLIVGEKLVIEGEEGCFFIGDGEKISPEEKGDFGLYIFDKVGSEKIKRIFLGLNELANGDKQARLELYSKDGKKLVISDEGLLQCNSTSGYDYVDGSHPCSGYFYADNGINIIDKCLLRFRCGRLRSTTTGSTSGGTVIAKTTSDGGTTTTESGGGCTSSSNGSHRHAMFVNGNTLGFSDGLPKAGYYQFGQASGGYSPVWANINMISSSGGFESTIYTAEETGSHTHTIGNHSHSIGNHSHNFSVNTEHSHTQIYGIYEDNVVASNVSVYVNGTLVRSGLNGDVELDIKNFIKVGQWNKIEFSSATNGCIHWDLFMKSFNLF